MTQRRISLLGATGSIGDSTLDVIARHPDRFAVAALTAQRPMGEARAALPAPSARRRRAVRSGRGAQPRARAGGRRAADAGPLRGGRHRRSRGIERRGHGRGGDRRGGRPAADACRRARRQADPARQQGSARHRRRRVHGGGGAGRRDAAARSTASTTRSSSAFRRATRAMPTQSGVRRILLTASGGPFRTRPLAELAAVTADEACAHPNWVMGRKISVDSATMMNKGLEMIEAHWLFGVPPERIEVVVHPQSVIHSLVEYVDGSMLAQLGNPDMRTPIAQALAYPGSRGRRGAGARTRAAGRAHVRGPRPRALPVPRPRHGRAPRRRHRARGAQRGERSRRRRLPRRRASATPTSRPRAPRRSRACRRGRRARSTTRSPPTAKPAPSRGRG